MSAHSPIGFSGAPIWVPCPGSVSVSIMMPPEGDSDDADEGTATHELGEMRIRAATNSHMLSLDNMRGSPVNNVMVDDDMIEAAMIYSDHVISVMRSTGNFMPFIEQRLDAPQVHELCFGTPDCWLYDPRTDTLYVWDFKYGFGVREVFENWQLLTGASAACAQLGKVPANIQLIVTQPRAPHRDGQIRNWTLPGSQLATLYVDKANDAAHAALSATPYFETGSHCRYCRGMLRCTANVTAVHDCVEIEGLLGSTDIAEEDVGTAYAILEAAKERITHRLDTLEPVLLNRIRTGNQTCEYNLLDSYSRVQWDIPHEQVLTLGKNHNIDLSRDMTFTPTQAIARGLDEKHVALWSSRKPRGTKLVRDDNKRSRYVFGYGGNKNGN